MVFQIPNSEDCINYSGGRNSWSSQYDYRSNYLLNQKTSTNNFKIIIIIMINVYNLSIF